MTSSADNDYLDLWQAVRFGNSIESLIRDLALETSTEAIPDGERWSKVDCAFELDKVREEYRKEFVRSSKVGVNSLTVTQSEHMLTRMHCRLPILLERSSAQQKHTTFHAKFDYWCFRRNGQV